jgi:hypothetical protein
MEEHRIDNRQGAKCGKNTGLYFVNLGDLGVLAVCGFLA